jgi:hypothetical protein
MDQIYPKIKTDPNNSYFKINLDEEIQIVDGMPDIESFDFDKYEIGGCTVMDAGPTHWCVDCSKGFRKNSKI